MRGKAVVVSCFEYGIAPKCSLLEVVYAGSVSDLVIVVLFGQVLNIAHVM